MLTCQPCGIKSIPTSAEVNDRWGNGGSGIGAGSKAIQSALGEYFERRHFYMEVMPDQQGPLGYSLTPEEKISFAVALSQTSEKAHQPERLKSTLLIYLKSTEATIFPVATSQPRAYHLAHTKLRATIYYTRNVIHAGAVFTGTPRLLYLAR